MTAAPGWISIYPWWYVQERERMRKRFPQFSPSEAELEEGTLAFTGTFTFDFGRRVESVHGLLLYDEQTPFHIPHFFPLEALPPGSDWLVEDVLHAHTRRMPAGYRRHQMASGLSPKRVGPICLIETGAGRIAESVSGVEVLRRAQDVFRALLRGKPFPFPDAIGDELEAHFFCRGDIVLGDAFFNQLPQQGTFWAVATMDEYRIMPNFVDQSKPSRQLLVGLHITGSVGGVIADWRTESSAAIRRAFPFTANGRLSFEAQTAEGSEFMESAQLEGRWYSLPLEPEPVADGKELAELLQAQLGLKDGVTELLAAFPKFGDSGYKACIGLRFPSRVAGEFRWLFLNLIPKDAVTKEWLEKEGPDVRREALRGCRLEALRSHHIADPELQLRNKGTVPATAKEATVVVLGCGALGGDVALMLAEAGVGKIILTDFDVVASGNVVRHVAGLGAVGLRKPDAVRNRIYQHNPFVNVGVFPHSATNPRETIDKLLEEQAVFVSTVADDNVEQVINEAAVRTGRTVVYGRAYRAGSACRVMRVRPEVDACLSCASRYRIAVERGDKSSWIIIPEDDRDIVGRECGQPVLAGSAVDLKFAASLVARAVLDEIGVGAEWNNMVFVRESWPGAPSPLALPYAIHRDSFPPRADCPMCVRPRVTAIEFEASAAAMLRRFAEAKKTVETGGALIGHEENGIVRIVEVTDAGPNAEETPTHFKYDADHVNKCLEDAVKRHGTRGVYVGEWHTHLESQPTPSPRDTTSLAEIALAPSNLTDEPVMVIAGLDPASGTVKGTHSSTFPIGRTPRTVPLLGWP